MVKKIGILIGAVGFLVQTSTCDLIAGAAATDILGSSSDWRWVTYVVTDASFIPNPSFDYRWTTKDQNPPEGSLPDIIKEKKVVQAKTSWLAPEYLDKEFQGRSFWQSYEASPGGITYTGFITSGNINGVDHGASCSAYGHGDRRSVNQRIFRSASIVASATRQDSSNHYCAHHTKHLVGMFIGENPQIDLISDEPGMIEGTLGSSPGRPITILREIPPVSIAYIEGSITYNLEPLPGSPAGGVYLDVHPDNSPMGADTTVWSRKIEQDTPNHQLYDGWVESLDIYPSGPGPVWPEDKYAQVRSLQFYGLHAEHLSTDRNSINDFLGGGYNLSSGVPVGEIVTYAVEEYFPSIYEWYPSLTDPVTAAASAEYYAFHVPCKVGRVLQRATVYKDTSTSWPELSGPSSFTVTGPNTPVTSISVAGSPGSATVSVAAEFGTLTVATSCGLVAINGNGTSNLALEGDISTLNCALATLSYGNNDFKEDIVNLTITQNGNSSSLAITMVGEIPAAPTDLTVNPYGKSAHLHWIDNSSSEGRFIIERKTGTGAYSVIASVPANSNTYVDSGLVLNELYCYRVKAGSSGGDSSWSNEACTEISCVALTAGRFNGTNFEFTVLGESNHTYQVLASTNSVDWDWIGSLSLTNEIKTFSDSQATNYTNRFYKLTNSGCCSEAIGFMSVTAPGRDTNGNGGYASIANQLDNGHGNELSDLMPVMPDGTSIYKWDTDVNGYALSVWDGFDQSWSNGQDTLAPGEGALLRSPSSDPITVTFIGKLRQGNLQNSFPSGYSMRSSIVPQAGTVTNLGLSMSEFSNVYKWNIDTQQWDVYTFLNGMWDNVPEVEIGESIFLSATAAGSWDRIYTFCGTPSEPVQLLDGLKGYWKLDETSSIRYDSTANAFDMSPFNTVAFDSNGVLNGASSFSASWPDKGLYTVGTNAQVELTFSNDWTVSCWINGSTSRPYSIDNIFSKPGEIYLWRDANDELTIYLMSGAPNYSVLLDHQFAFTISPNQWQQIALRRSGNTIDLFVDGEFEETVAFTGTIQNGNWDFWIGMQKDGWPWNGSIDEVGYWGRGLNVTEINTLFGNGIPPAYEAFTN